MVEHWVQQRVTFLAPYVMTFDGRRVQGGHDVRALAGSVLHIRVRVRAEVLDPGASTEGSGPSLGTQTHDTWSSLSLGPVRDETEDHSLLQLSSFDSRVAREETDGDAFSMMQHVEVIDAEGRIHDQRQDHWPANTLNDWKWDVEAILPALRSASRTRDGDFVVQIIAGLGTDLRDRDIRVPVGAMQSAEAFQQLMSSDLPSNFHGRCRCFLARFRFDQTVPLIIAVRELSRLQVPQLIWYRGVTRMAVKKVVLVESPHVVVEYYYWTADRMWMTAAFQPGSHHFRVDGKLVRSTHIVPWIPATVVQIDQVSPCGDDEFDAILPTPVNEVFALMQTSSRRSVGQ